MHDYKCWKGKEGAWKAENPYGKLISKHKLFSATVI